MNVRVFHIIYHFGYTILMLAYNLARAMLRHSFTFVCCFLFSILLSASLCFCLFCSHPQFNHCCWSSISTAVAAAFLDILLLFFIFLGCVAVVYLSCSKCLLHCVTRYVEADFIWRLHRIYIRYPRNFSSITVVFFFSLLLLVSMCTLYVHFHICIWCFSM